EENYRYMLSYAARGADDPGRDAMADELGETVLDVVDILERDNLAADETSLYYSTFRFERTRPDESPAALVASYVKVAQEASPLAMASLGLDETARRQRRSAMEAMERRLFARLWVTHPLGTADAQAVRDAMASESVPSYFRELLVGALLLGSLEYYDPAKLELIMEAYAARPEGRAGATALVAMLLVMHRWRSRRLTPRLRARLEAIRETPAWKSDLHTAYMELARTRDTERLTAKMRDEVMPTMMKLRPDLEKKLGDASLKEFDLENIEENPEWESIFEKSGLADQMREISEITMEGGDIMMSAFGAMKSHPFFSEIANWFIPFHADRSEFAGAGGKFAGFLEPMPFLNDSDKYSVVLSLAQMPQQQASMMMRQLEQHGDQMAMAQAEALNTAAADRRNQLNKQVQNLYRFFNLFRRKGEFHNPFAAGVSLVEIPAIAADVSDSSTLGVIGEFYFRHKYFAEALAVFRVLEKNGEATDALYQKMGHALQRLGDTDEELRMFEQADMLNAGSAWTLRRLARGYLAAGRAADALATLDRLETIEPDKAANALLRGHCHLQLEEYDEAVKALFKADYLDPKSGKALRPLAWGLLMQCDLEQSRKYYERLIATRDPLPADYLNLGHLSLAERRFREAMNFYKLNITARRQPDRPGTSGGNAAIQDAVEAFIADMRGDTPALLRIGVDPSLVPLIIDSILYELD
ncbi:MAG: hypothetical protein K2O33_07665, partial [Muribaculaceae bacterium]|nr:hypothetical protein [Muribaculaceae bacterium]